jgi:cytochrome c oxidase cbb3-type subunit 3
MRTLRRIRLLPVLLLMLLPALPATARAGSEVQALAADMAASAAALPAELATGQRVYNERCYFCHGYAGDARTLAATYLQPPPLDFGSARAQALDEATLIARVTQGVPGTAMQPFGRLLSSTEIEAVSRFVLQTMIRQRRPNTLYHTVENGWPQHERYRAAYPFALGEIALDSDPARLTPEQQQGRRLFMSSCISCHDHARVREPGQVWESRPVSFPRDAYCTSCHAEPLGSGLQGGTADQVGTPYRLHDRAPRPGRLTAQQRHGERLYQRNCAYCHAADGTARSWIGQFLEPHARDLTDPAVMAAMTPSRLRNTILEGLPGTSMPAWRGLLGEADIRALVAYIGRVFHPLRPD